MADSFSVPWTKFKALSFDIYGTLIDWQDGIIDAALATKLQPYFPTGRMKLYEGLRKYDRAIEQELSHLRKSEINAEALKRYATELDLVVNGKVSQHEVDEAAQEYGSAIGAFPAFPDTVNAIQRLAQHYHLIPLSNIDHTSFSRTLSGPLQGCTFSAAYIAEDIGSYKPDRRNFEYLLDHLKSDFSIDPDEVCHVAQSLHHDHATTKIMGLKSVWVDRYGVLGDGGEERLRELKEEYGFRLRVESLGELADIVDRAFAE